MYLKIKKANVVESTYWKNIVISMIWLYNDNDKRVKWIKLDENVASILTTIPIKISDDSEYNK